MVPRGGATPITPVTLLTNDGNTLLLVGDSGSPLLIVQ
jgi:hypothetical protein